VVRGNFEELIRSVREEADLSFATYGDQESCAVTRPVLLVDDDEPIRRPLKELLEAEGYSVVTAANGRDALLALRTMEPPGVILLDLMMPVMSGGQLLDALRADPALHAIPVIILSAWLHRWTSRMVDSGHMQVLPKPIDTDRLLALVRTYCGERRRETMRRRESRAGESPKH
jgi:CheY-like chemotaxis protein